MAKIKEQDDFDDLNFDDLGDFDDFGGFDDMEPEVGKRNVFSRLAGGFKDGVKASFTDPNTHRTIIKEALPKGYSRIYDSAEFTMESTSELLDTARKGWGENRDQMKKAMREILPSFGENTNGSKIGQRLRAWSEDVRSPHVVEDVDQERAFMATELADVFGAPGDAAVEQKSSSEDRATKEGAVVDRAQRKLMDHAAQTSQILSDRIGVQQNSDMVRHLSGMHAELQRLTAYQDQVTNQYQRKSLEIKYRHYFVSRKSLDVLQQTLELNQASYDKIITNTSLPEAVKIQSNEHAQMILREKFLGDVITPASQSFATIGRKIVQKSKQRIQQFFKDLGAGLGNITDSTSSILGPDSGIDPLELGGDIVGQQAGAWGAKKLAKKISGKLAQNQKLARLGAAGASLANNGGRIFQSLLKSDTGIKAFEWLKGTGFLDEFAYRRDETIRKDASSMLDDQAMWDQKSRKALTEVIPGLLEKINYNTAVAVALARGDTTMPEMQRYNYASGLFESDKEVRSRIKSDIFGEKANNDTAQALRNFVAEFETQTKLSEGAKRELMKIGLDEALNGGDFDFEGYLKGEKLFSKDEKIQAEILKAFKARYNSDYIEGVDDEDKTGLGRISANYRRSETIGARDKLRASVQTISNNAGVYNNAELIKHMGVAGGNDLLDMGAVYRDGNSLKMNRDVIDENVFNMAMGMDAGYLASTLFDLEETEDTLGNSVNSAVRRMIADMDKRFAKDMTNHDINFLRFVYDNIQNSFFSGSNAELLGKTDLDVYLKKEALQKCEKKIIEYMGTPQFNSMSDKGQEYFKLRLDIIKRASAAARITAPLKDFFKRPLEEDKDIWAKSKDKALEALSDAGLDPEILERLKSSIREVKDSSGKTVDMKIAEITGTKTYAEAARLMNAMSDKGLKWITHALRDPNTPPQDVSDRGSLFNRVGKTAEHLGNHSVVGRFIYGTFVKAEAALNNSYANLQEGQAKLSELDRLAGNANGENFFYDGSFSMKKANPLKATGYGALTPSQMGYANGPLAEDATLNPLVQQKEDRIVTRAVDSLTRIGDRIAQELKDYVANGQKITLPDSSVGPTLPVGQELVGPRPADIEIHHTGGIVGRGAKWGGAGDLFGNAPRYHKGGMVKGTLDIRRDPSDHGLLIATLPNGEEVTIRSKTLTRMGTRASKRHSKEAFRLAEKEVRARYSQHFKEDPVSETLNPSASTSPLKVDEVPAVLQKGEEVLTADDPRHRNNIGKVLDKSDDEALTKVESNIRELLENQPTPMTSSADEYLQGILENTTLANELLQAIVEKEFKGGMGLGLDKITDKIKGGWEKAKTKAGGIKTSITKLFKGSGGNGFISKARAWIVDKAVDAADKMTAGFAGIKNFAPKAGSWLKDKATAGMETAKELGEKLKAKIPTLDEIKKAGGVMVDKTWVPAKEFVSSKYEATKEWWKEHHPSFSLNFSEFWTGFKEKFKNWMPKLGHGSGIFSRLGSGIGSAWASIKETGSNILSAPRELKNWVGKKVRSGLRMLSGFMSGGAWAAMKYRNVEEITDPVSGLRQVYMGLVDLTSVVMDRIPKPKKSFFDKDGDGKRDQAARFMSRGEKQPRTDKDGNVLPGQEQKSEGLFGSIFGKSLLGFAIKALVGGIVGETMSNLFGFDLGLVGNTLAGMATVGGGLWAAKKAAGWAAGKAADGAKAGAGALWNKVRGKENLPGTGGIVPNQPTQKGKGGAMAAAAAGMLGGQGCGCCCCDDGLGDLGGSREDRRKKGKKPQRGRKAGRSGRGVRVPSAATNLAATGAQGASNVAQGAGRAGGLAGRLGGLGGRLGTVGALVGGGLALSAISSDAEASEEEKTVATSEVVGGMGGSLAGAAAGAAIGSVVPIVGTAAGAIVGGIAGHWLGSKAGSGVGNALASTKSESATQEALLESAKQKSQTGAQLTPEEKKAVEEASKENPNFLVTLIKYSPIGLAWFAAQGLMNLIAGTLGIVWDGVKWVASGVGKVVGAAASLVGSAIGGVAGMIWNGTKFIVGTAAKVVGGVAGAVWDGAKWVAGTTGKILGGAAGLVWDGVKWVSKTAWNVATAPLKAVGWVAGKAWEGTKAVGSAVYNGTKAAVGAAATVLTAPLKGAAWLGKKAYEGAKAVGGAIAGAGKKVWGGIKKVASGAFDVLKDVGGALATVTGLSLLLKAGGKLWNFLNKDENAITRFRFIQYGLSLHKGRDAKAVLGLESDHLENVTVIPGATPRLKITRPVEEYYEMFGVDPENEEQVKNWLIWYHYRFKPVFLSHVSEWSKSMRNTKLHSGDEKLGAEAAKVYLKNVHYINAERAPYNQTSNPFGGDDDALPGVKEVNRAYEVALSKVKHFPSKPLTDMEKNALGLADVEQNQAAVAKLEKEKEREESAKDEDKDGPSTWEKIKSGVGGAFTKAKDAVVGAAKAVGGAIVNGASAVGNAVEGAWEQVKAMTGTNKAKYNKIRIAACTAGDPHPDVVAAQWALESGWGKKQSGKHNYFGIKAQKGEAGKTVRTREVINGQNVMIYAVFKNYESLEEGIADRVAFIKNNPRYTKAGYFTAVTPKEAAMALQKGGYATDPNYVNLICKIIKGCGYNPNDPSTTNNAKAPKGVDVKQELGDKKVAQQIREEDTNAPNTTRPNEREEEKGGFWNKVKSGAASAADKLNPMNFFTKQDENQMSGWDRMTNAVTTFGQEAAGTIGSWAGGGKQYASHELTLAKACIAAGMTNPKEVAMFIAQCAHETGGFKWLKELGNDSYFRKYNNRKDLGNGPNDGARFKGRGYIQLTGRYNYTRFAKASGIDVVSNPDLVSNDKNVAAKASLFWWLSNKRARAAGQAGDVVAASKAVNGGTNGLADRQKKWAYYSKVIGNDLNAWVAKLESSDKGVLEKAGDAIGKGASAVKGAVQDAGHAVGAAAVGVRAQTAGAVASGVTAINQTSAKIVDGAKSALSAVTGNAAVGSDSTTDGKGKNGTPWMKLAEKQVGVNEDDHENIVRDYHKVGGSLNAGGKTPWCASFVGWVLEKSGIRSTRSAAANSYDKWGQKLAKTNIPFGAIIRVRFKDGNHVAFCTGDKGGARVSTLGGNQSSKKGGSRRNGGEVTLSSVARSEIVSVSYPEGYKPSGGSLSGGVGGAATPEAGEVGAAAVGGDGGSGSTPGERTGQTGNEALSSDSANTNDEWNFKWKGRTDGKATYSEMDRLAKLQGKGPSSEATTTLSPTAQKAVVSSENKKADETRTTMGNWDKNVAAPTPPSIKAASPTSTAPDSELQRIAGFGFNAATNSAAVRPISVTPAQTALAKQTSADLNAVKAAEVDALAKRAQESEAERVAQANEKAKANRVVATTQATQADVVNIMRESLAETKQMHQTLREINRGIQKLVSGQGSQNLRGEEKPKSPSQQRRPTPAENVPVTMRVT